MPTHCHPYPTEWPTECFVGLRQLYAEGRLFTDLACTHHHIWTIQGFLAGKLLGSHDCDGDSETDSTINPIGADGLPVEVVSAMQALSVETDGIKAACQASQGVVSELLKSALAELVRQGLPKLLDVINRYLDQLDL